MDWNSTATIGTLTYQGLRDAIDELREQSSDWTFQSSELNLGPIGITGITPGVDCVIPEHILAKRRKFEEYKQRLLQY